MKKPVTWTAVVTSRKRNVISGWPDALSQRAAEDLHRQHGTDQVKGRRDRAAGGPLRAEKDEMTSVATSDRPM